MTDAAPGGHHPAPVTGPRRTRVTGNRVRVTGNLFHPRVPDGAVYVGRGAPGLPASPFANPCGVRRTFPRHHPLRPALELALTGAAGRDPADLRQRACDVMTPGTAAVAVAAYRIWLSSQPRLLAAACAQLAGRDLACWCPPGAACHVDVLLEEAARPAPGMMRPVTATGSGLASGAGTATGRDPATGCGLAAGAGATSGSRQGEQPEVREEPA